MLSGTEQVSETEKLFNFFVTDTYTVIQTLHRGQTGREFPRFHLSHINHKDSRFPPERPL